MLGEPEATRASLRRRRNDTAEMSFIVEGGWLSQVSYEVSWGDDVMI
jgi:hypothetical protein